MRKMYLLIFFILFSCTPEDEKIFKRIEGVWLIDKVTYKIQNIREEFYVNTLIFEKINGSSFIKIPRTESHEAENAFISITSKNDSSFIEIESINKKIRGTYDMKFRTDDNNILILELSSNKCSFLLKKLPTVSERIF